MVTSDSVDKTFYSEDIVMETYERVMKYISSDKDEQDGYNWLCKLQKQVAYAYNNRKAVFDNFKTTESNEYQMILMIELNLKQIWIALSIDRIREAGQ